MKHIMKCDKCKTYTMKQECSSCSSRTVLPKPARFSPDDKYGSYRRKAKEDQLKSEGLL